MARISDLKEGDLDRLARAGVKVGPLHRPADPDKTLAIPTMPDDEATFPPAFEGRRAPLPPPDEDDASVLASSPPNPPSPAVAVPSAQAAPTPGAQGRLVVAFACKGGVGNTFTTVNLAASLARHTSVCLIDMDLQMGDALVSLNMEGRCALSHMIREIRSQGESFSPPSILDRHERTGIYVLSQVHCLEELEFVTPSEVGNLLQFMKRKFPAVIVDGLRGFDDNSMYVFDAADAILLVVNQDVPSVRSARRSMEIFRRIGFDDSKVLVVINRYNRKSLFSPNHVAMSLKIKHYVTVREDDRLASRSLNEGVPLHLLAPDSRIAADVDALAEALFGRRGGGGGARPQGAAAPPPPARKKGFFGKLLGK